MLNKLLLIGCGNLGKALLKSWSENNIGHEIVVVQPSLSAKPLFANSHTITFVSKVEEIPAAFLPDAIVLAIKPQQIHDALPYYANYAAEALIISLAAGVPLNKLTTYLADHKKMVRVMPNVAMQIGASVNLTYADNTLSANERQQIEGLFSATGKMIWVEKETLIDTLTPISACGPAYFFLLAESLTQITLQLGLQEEQARELIQQTFLGSALLTANTIHFEKMMHSVASKGGATEAALHVLQPALSDLMSNAIDAALKRLQELAQ